MTNAVFLNAKILTMDPVRPFARAVAVENGRITGVGSHDEVMAVAHPDARVYDLRGKPLVPGFNDCHMHILPYGLDLSTADLSPAAGVTSVPDLVIRLHQWADENPTSEWILGGRYDQNTFPGAAHPTRQELDIAFPDEPVYIMQTSKHAGVANSMALHLAGVTRDTPDPDGGEIVRDAEGEPTGVLLETAVGLVTRLIPQPDRAGMVAAIRRANDALLRAGVTSASDLNTGWFDLETEIACYKQAAEEGAPIRMTLFPHAPNFGSPDDVPTREEFARAFGAEDAGSGVRLGHLKLFSDGALTVRTAALRQPYVDGSGMGMLLHEPEELRAYVLRGHTGGWPVAIHAIGDRAVELVLDCYAAAQAAQPRDDARHRIEHAMLLDENLINRIVEQNVIPVAQPEFLSRLGDAYVLGLGQERASTINPTVTLQKAGVGVPFSSDCPIVPGAPLDGIRAAHRRTTRTGQLLGPEERVSVEDGFRNYSYWAAYASFDEQETGAVRRGLRADFTVLEGDPFDNIDDVRVAATIIGGAPVYGEEVLR